MRVAVQASDLDHQRIDGTRVYLKELLKRFGDLSPETAFFLYHRGMFNPNLAPPKRANYQPQSLPFPHAWMQTRFAWELFRIRPEKLFLPIQAAPVLLPRSLDVTATIHDLAFRHYPETFPAALRFKLNFMLETAVSRADKLIAVSQSTKRDLLQFFPHLPESRIRVIHHGFDAELFGTRLSEEGLSNRLMKLAQLEYQSYVLYVGALQPRKNLVRLIQAFAQAKKQIPTMKLVLAGEAAWLAQDILAAKEESPFREDIILTGRVSFEDLQALYQGARFFVFPSLYEGFGLPILEAFASEVAVLTTENSSLTEVAGNAALYCNAESVDDMAEKLERLWYDEVLRQELIARGKRQLQIFSWEKCAEETLQYILS
ncbi:MAG: glycosyltransferase family 1 protein [Candidatus Moranbacteria bacterium]|nr:glycosyltransferase family 1 protein [Candidatus Moranbacteria bacterium]